VRPVIQRALPAFLALAALSAQAEIALFIDGRSLKISGSRVVGTNLELTLPSGGALLLPVDRVERIVDDEVVPVVTISEDDPLAKRAWRFDEGRKPLFESEYTELIIAAAKKFDVDAALVSAVIKAESDYNPKVVSHKGAQGLMQLMPATAKRFGVGDAFDPSQNIHGGTKYLRWLLDKFEGNAQHAVAAYNAGEGNVWKYKGVPPFRETINYVKKISRHFERAKLATLTSSLIR
jgi:hypothetical protein